MVKYKDINIIKVSLGNCEDETLKSELEYKINLNKYSTITIDFKTVFEKYTINDEQFKLILDTLYNDIIQYLKNHNDYIILDIETSDNTYKKCMRYYLLDAMKKYGNNISPLYELFILTMGD